MDTALVGFIEWKSLSSILSLRSKPPAGLARQIFFSTRNSFARRVAGLPPQPAQKRRGSGTPGSLRFILSLGSKPPRRFAPAEMVQHRSTVADALGKHDCRSESGAFFVTGPGRAQSAPGAIEPLLKGCGGTAESFLHVVWEIALADPGNGNG